MTFTDEKARARRVLMQQIITHPDAIADLLVELLERVERLEWMVCSHATETSRSEVQGTVDGTMQRLLKTDPVTFLPR